MFLSGLVRPSVWAAIFRARGKGVSGNMEGEGRLLGGKLFYPLQGCLESAKIS